MGTLRKNIIWLASYPKSGNTWFRVLLSNYLAKDKVPVNINNLERSPIASSRVLFDEISGVNSSELTFDEIDLIRPEVFKSLSSESKEYQYFKVHDSFRKLSNDEYLFPAEITYGAVYIVRNPFDISFSLANHSQISIEEAVEKMCDSNFAFSSRKDRLNYQLRQILGSWSDHVISWTKQSVFPVHIIRYEDMLKSPEESFEKALSFLGLEIIPDQIEWSVINSSFTKLKEQEDTFGFKERPIKADRFFRKGIAGEGKKHLDSKLQNQIIEAHKSVMEIYGY